MYRQPFLWHTSPSDAVVSSAVVLSKVCTFEIKESKITRGHNFTLVKKQSRLDVRKFSFSQRTINVWNTLSEECVHASSVNMFKNREEKYLLKAGVYTK